MILPRADEVIALLDATWPPAEIVDAGGVRLRRGAGGGKRVSAATALCLLGADEIVEAEAAMSAMGQAPLFMLGEDDGDLDTLLAARGYGVVDPVTLFAAPTQPGPVPPSAKTRSPALDALWAAGGIGPARRAVMDRVKLPKAALVVPDGEAPAGAVFVAAAGRGAMLHALHVEPGARRRGLGRSLTAGASAWAHANRADWIALAVTDANGPAKALYASLGFEAVGRYHYRISGD